MDEFNLFEEKISKLDTTSRSSLYIDELRNPNHNIRLYCIRNLNNVAEILGPERTEEELLPMLIDLLVNFEENEEVLYEVGTQLVKLVEYIPAKTNYNANLRGLELLAGNDDETVRQNATDNLCKLITCLDEGIITNEIFPLMQRLIQNDMKSKISCCYLFPVVYPKLNNLSIKRDLIQAYHEISRDDSPSVRRAAAFNIKNFANIRDNELIKELITLHTELLKDNIDIVKVNVIESTNELMLNLPEDQQKKMITGFNSAIKLDKSWRVKYAAAESICEICSNFDENFNELNFLPMIMLFLKDNEPEVRSSVLLKLPKFIKHISKQKFLNSLVPILSDHIASDTNAHVKSIFASSVVQCCRELTPEFFNKHICNMITNIFKEDTYDTKLSAVENFEALANFISNDDIMLNTLLPILNQLSKDNKWRIRLTLAEKVNAYYDLIDKKLFISYFLPILKSFYNDHASEIRELSYKVLYKLCKDNNEKFIKENVWEIIRSALYSNSYIIRISAIHTIESLKDVLGDGFINNDVLPFMSLLTSDKVPNVRFTLSKFYQSMFGYLNPRLRNSDKFVANLQDAKMTLNKFKDDRDIDVKYFSDKALDELNKLN
jgi:serine/threonine-protein phosphatase 2A regulatory subunit A